MSETTETVVPETPAPVAQVATPAAEVPLGKDGKPFDPERAQETIEKLRAENKAAKAAEKKLAEYEAAEVKRKEAEMSELEKLQSQLKTQEEKLHAAERREMQRAAAEKFHLPAELTDRLVGDALEAMEADAQKLAAALPKSAIISPGNPPSGATSETDAQRKARLFG